MGPAWPCGKVRPSAHRSRGRGQKDRATPSDTPPPLQPRPEHPRVARYRRCRIGSDLTTILIRRTLEL
ncbi:hypothetical protein FY030_09330 [Ornithinimicrobium pratense]|uniref:Uncharacterized protein n=1 Tax=Ornithinimicrobium pratense TaxID=2593973 RepID=A0A5J6V523_9MICO|nr:hypothetical protein FY030_09330 [Ornithinimicrobium pratense]